MHPLIRQLKGDRLGLGPAAQSTTSRNLKPRTATADRVVKSVCPYCAVGCGQSIYVKDERVVQIEGDTDSPISRRPRSTEWEDLDLDVAMDMIADRVIDTRRRTWEETGDDGSLLNRTRGFAHLGGATLDNEENYLIKKCFSALGAVSIENQARI